MPSSGRALYLGPRSGIAALVRAKVGFGRAPSSIAVSWSLGAGKGEPTIVPTTALSSIHSPRVSAPSLSPIKGKNLEYDPASLPDFPTRFQKLSAIIGSVPAPNMTASTLRL